MATFLLIAKIVVVIFFLAMFLYRANLVWAIGLLTVTSALLLDSFLGAFGREQLEGELGFFFYVVGGVLFAGAALWLWGVLRPAVAAITGVSDAPVRRVARPGRPAPAPAADDEVDAVDRGMLYDQIRTRLSPADIHDLIFDLEFAENDIIAPGEPMNETIIRLMDVAAHQGKQEALALAVERALTPVPPGHLPRLEKLSPDSPPTIFRHYLLAHYEQAELTEMATALEVDWERLDAANKQSLVRNLLLYLQRRSRTADLLALMQSRAGIVPQEEAEAGHAPAEESSRAVEEVAEQAEA